MTKEKKLTVQEKKYLMQRIEGIVSNKIAEIQTEYKGKLAPRHDENISRIFKGVLAGKVELRTLEQIRETIREIVDEYEKARKRQRHHHYHSCGRLRDFDIIDRDSADRYKASLAKKFEGAAEERDERLAKLRAAATELQDEIMLGNGTPKALQDFEKTSF
jgi:uncharacterized protein YukE